MKKVIFEGAINGVFSQIYRENMEGKEKWVLLRHVSDLDKAKEFMQKNNEKRPEDKQIKIVLKQAGRKQFYFTEGEISKDQAVKLIRENEKENRLPLQPIIKDTPIPVKKPGIFDKASGVKDNNT